MTKPEAQRPWQFIAAEPGLHWVRLARDDEGEWFTWQEPVIGWVLQADDEGKPMVEPMVWDPEFRCAESPTNELCAASNATDVGLFHAGAIPTWGDFEQAASTVLASLRRAAERRAS